MRCASITFTFINTALTADLANVTEELDIDAGKATTARPTAEGEAVALRCNM